MICLFKVEGLPFMLPQRKGECVFFDGTCFAVVAENFAFSGQSLGLIDPS